jgi:Protein of unknown function (DUF3631)
LSRWDTEKLLREDEELLRAVEALPLVDESPEEEEPEPPPPPPKPDPAEVGADILDDVDTFIHRFVAMSDAQVTVLSLWTVHTHCIAAADSTAYMAVNSAEKESGKTRLEEVEDLLVANSWFTGRVTAACLTRKIDSQKPTLLLDESDTAFASGEEYAEALRGVLNTGHRRGGKTSCCVGTGANIGFKDFATFCPKMIAGLKRLPDTVASRSVPIHLERRKPEVQIERFRRRRVEPEASQLRGRIATWSKSQIKRLREIEPELPEELSDRQADGVEPLLAIAELVGHGWPEKARKALVDLCKSVDAEDSSLGVCLLRDIADIFVAENTDRVSSKTMVEKLVAIETSPWAELPKNHKPLTQNSLATMLKKYRDHDGNRIAIASRSIRVGGGTPKGYYRKFFLEAWSRYVPSVPKSLLDAAKKDVLDEEEQEQERDTSVADVQNSLFANRNAVSPNKDAPCGGVAVEKGGMSEEGVEGEL